MTIIRMVKGTLSTGKVVAYYKNCPDDSHISKSQKHSAI